MLDLVVHIGAHKTGTTAIQYVALNHESELLSSGVHYPANRPYYPYDQHSRIADLMRRGRSGQVMRFLAAAAREAKSVGATCVFLSGEELWTLSTRSVANFRKLARQQFARVRVVCTLRNEEDRILSNFKHFLRHDPSRTVDQFIRSNKRILRPAPKIWKSLFPDNFIIVDYDKNRRNLIPHFFKKVFSIDLKINPQQNSSFDMMSLEVINTFVKDWKCEDTERVLWSYFSKYESWPEMPIESQIRDMILGRSNVRKRYHSSPATTADYDPVEICDRMLYLFGELKEVFEKLRIKK